MRCSVCEKWELGASDSFCSWCSEKVQPLTLSLEPANFIAGHPAEEARLTIMNGGSAGTIRIKRTWADHPEWLRIDNGPPGGRELNEGSELVLDVSVDPSGLADNFHAGLIYIETESNGTWETQVSVSPVPSWEVTAPPLYLEQGQKEVRLPLNLTVEKGTLTLKAIEAKTNGWAEVIFDGEGLKLDARRNGSYEFPLVIYTDQMPRDRAGQHLDKYEVELWLEFAELYIGSTKTVRFPCLNPPQLVIIEQAGGTLQVEAFRNETEEVTLHLQNGFIGETGRSALTIKACQSSKPWLQPKSTLPLTIESGKTATLDFLIDAGDANLVGAEEERATLLLETEPSGKDGGKVSLSVLVRVKDRSAYAGWLCLDFGTTNTCVGRSDLDKDGNPKLLMIDISTQTSTSSVIQYRDLDVGSGKRLYTVGKAAYQQLYKPIAEGTVFDQIKRKLGHDEKLTVRFLNRKNQENEPTQKLTPKEIATDIFKRLLANSEKILRTQVVRCAISHPSRVSRLQLKDLHEALIEAFKPYDIPAENIKFFHEPVAAAVDYLTTQSEAPPKEGDYHLIVYDFGGGTTDIALIRVSEKMHPKRGRIVRPEVLTVDGDPALGGEDVTDMLMNLYHSKIEQQEASGGEQVSPHKIRLPLDTDKESDLVLRKLARENRAVLRQWAEEQKIELSMRLSRKEESLDPLALSTEVLTYIVDGKPVENALKFIEPVTKDEFNGKLAEMIKPSVQKMTELLGKINLHPEDISYVLLSGHSSAFPIVKEMIQEQLGLAEEKVQRLKHPKECVVRGLCALQSDELTAGLTVMVETQGSLGAATSRLGLRVRDRGQWKFKQLIGAGMPIGKEGYRCEVKEVFFKRNTALPLYEHMGPETDNSFDEDDRRISVVKIFRLSDKLAEMGEDGKRVTDEMLFDAELWFSIDDNHRIELDVKFKEEENLPPIKFEATYGGY